MAGHSKWANIKHRKGAQDAKRGKVFTKIIREITVGSKMGDPDPITNPRLRLAVDKALAVNMPKDTIKRAIQRGAGNTESENYEEISYEGYGAGGVAILVACMTDNRNRTVGEVRHAFSKCAGNLGTDGSVAYLFNKLGVFHYETAKNEDAILDIALEAGADDVLVDADGSLEVLSSFEDYLTVKEALEKANFIADHSEVTMRAETLTAIDAKTAEKVLRLTDMLEDLDDVQAVYSNADISTAVMEQLAEA